MLYAADVDGVDAHGLSPACDPGLGLVAVASDRHDRGGLARIDHSLPRNGVESFDDERIGVKGLHDLTVRRRDAVFEV